MTALEGDRLQMRRVKVAPETVTRGRRAMERRLGRKVAPFPAEIAAYEAAGQTPPTE